MERETLFIIRDALTRLQDNSDIPENSYATICEALGDERSSQNMRDDDAAATMAMLRNHFLLTHETIATKLGVGPFTYQLAERNGSFTTEITAFFLGEIDAKIASSSLVSPPSINPGPQTTSPPTEEVLQKPTRKPSLSWSSLPKEVAAEHVVNALRQKELSLLEVRETLLMPYATIAMVLGVNISTYLDFENAGNTHTLSSPRYEALEKHLSQHLKPEQANQLQRLKESFSLRRWVENTKTGQYQDAKTAIIALRHTLSDSDQPISRVELGLHLDITDKKEAERAVIYLSKAVRISKHDLLDRFETFLHKAGFSEQDIIGTSHFLHTNKTRHAVNVETVLAPPFEGKWDDLRDFFYYSTVDISRGEHGEQRALHAMRNALDLTPNTHISKIVASLRERFNISSERMAQLTDQQNGDVYLKYEAGLTCFTPTLVNALPLITARTIDGDKIANDIKAGTFAHVGEVVQTIEELSGLSTREVGWMAGFRGGKTNIANHMNSLKNSSPLFPTSTAKLLNLNIVFSTPANKDVFTCFVESNTIKHDISSDNVLQEICDGKHPSSHHLLDSLITQQFGNHNRFSVATGIFRGMISRWSQGLLPTPQLAQQTAIAIFGESTATSHIGFFLSHNRLPDPQSSALEDSTFFTTLSLPSNRIEPNSTAILEQLSTLPPPTKRHQLISVLCNNVFQTGITETAQRMGSNQAVFSRWQDPNYTDQAYSSTREEVLSSLTGPADEMQILDRLLNGETINLAHALPQTTIIPQTHENGLPPTRQAQQQFQLPG